MNQPALFELTYERFDIHGRTHTERTSRPWGTHDSEAEARAAANQVLADEYVRGGVVTITRITMDAYWHTALAYELVAEMRR